MKLKRKSFSSIQLQQEDMPTAYTLKHTGETYSASVTCLSRPEDRIKVIKEKLDDVQMERFKSSCFGHLLNINHLQWSGQLVHALLLRQASCEGDKHGRGLSFLFGKYVIRFCDKDFALVTGLRFGKKPMQISTSTQTEDEDMTIRLKGLYFPKVKAVSYRDLENALRSCTHPEDIFKLALVYFVHCVLLAKQSRSFIDLRYLKLVDDLESFNQFPWGSLSYELTIDFLSKATERGKNKYELWGFPYAFQVWAYESIPGIAQRGFAEKVECEAHPRILHWKSRGVLTHKVIVDHILQCDEPDVEFMVIEPSVDEKNQPYWCARWESTGGDEDGCSNAQSCDKVQDGRLKNSKKAKQTNLTSNNSNTLLTDCNESFLGDIQEAMAANFKTELHEFKTQLLGELPSLIRKEMEEASNSCTVSEPMNVLHEFKTQILGELPSLIRTEIKEALNSCTVSETRNALHEFKTQILGELSSLIRKERKKVRNSFVSGTNVDEFVGSGYTRGVKDAFVNKSDKRENNELQRKNGELEKERNLRKNKLELPEKQLQESRWPKENDELHKNIELEKQLTVEKKAMELCSCLKVCFRDPTWNPFKIIMDEQQKPVEVINEEDKKLMKLKMEFGDEAFGAVTTRLGAWQK